MHVTADTEATGKNGKGRSRPLITTGAPVTLTVPVPVKAYLRLRCETAMAAQHGCWKSSAEWLKTTLYVSLLSPRGVSRCAFQPVNEPSDPRNLIGRKPQLEPHQSWGYVRPQPSRLVPPCWSHHILAQGPGASAGGRWGWVLWGRVSSRVSAGCCCCCEGSPVARGGGDEPLLFAWQKVAPRLVIEASSPLIA